MASLLRKSSKYHSLIEVHLLEHKEERLLEYFRKVVRGEEGAFEADRVLLERNFSYRQFVLILQRKWTEEAATDPLS